MNEQQPMNGYNIKYAKKIMSDQKHKFLFNKKKLK